MCGFDLNTKLEKSPAHFYNDLGILNIHIGPRFVRAARFYL